MRKDAAVIWDMDGVIADTAAAHYASWQQAFQRRGILFAEEQFRMTFGMRNDAIIRSVLGNGVADDEMQAISLEKEIAFRATARDTVKSLPGVIPLMAGLEGARVRMAVASSAPLENLHLLMDSLGVARFIQAVVADQDVKHGKPDPEVFLLAASRLDVGPGHCLVIEDAVAGVRACLAAGMKCLAVTNTRPREELKEAHLVVDSLEEVDAARLLRLLEET